MKRMIVPMLALSAGSMVFFLFSYNSGYGYDALEYLVIGRSLLDGYRMYDFIPSKSWGLYTFVAGFLRMGPLDNHLGVALLVTLIFAATLAMTYAVVIERHDRLTAAIAAGLVGVSAFFMEMNFLEPEGLVLLCGLIGLQLIPRALETGNRRRLFCGGFVLGCGMAFKSVAAFYLVGAMLFTWTWSQGRDARGFRDTFIVEEIILLCGFTGALALPMSYFAVTGRLFEHVEWTFVFPFFERPADLSFLPKLLTKLLWFILLALAGLTWSFRSHLRDRIYRCSKTNLALCMGLAALIALLKQQASHYVFLAAGMLAIPLARVLAIGLQDAGLHGSRRLMAVASMGIFAVIVSILLYNPLAARRFLKVAGYDSEGGVREWIQNAVRPEERILAFRSGSSLYWISHRYPSVPFVSMDVQTSYILRRTPGLLAKALEDPRTVLVEFPGQDTWTRDRRFASEVVGLDLIGKVRARLAVDFLQSAAPPGEFILYRRRLPGKEVSHGD